MQDLSPMTKKINTPLFFFLLMFFVVGFAVRHIYLWSIPQVFICGVYMVGMQSHCVPAIAMLSSRNGEKISSCRRADLSESRVYLYVLFWLTAMRFCVCTISPLSPPHTPFSRSLRSTICNPEHPHPIRTLWITNGRPERAKKRSLRESERRSCDLTIKASRRSIWMYHSPPRLA